jgi:exonuclease VII small subunit
MPVSCQNRNAPPAHARRVGSIARVIVFWVALAVLVAASVAGAAFVLVRALQTKRAVKRLKAALCAELQRITRAGERTNEELEAARKAFERLEASLKRLSTAQARMRLVKETLAEAEAILTRARAFVPSK